MTKRITLNIIILATAFYEMGCREVDPTPERKNQSYQELERARSSIDAAIAAEEKNKKENLAGLKDAAARSPEQKMFTKRYWDSDSRLSRLNQEKSYLASKEHSLKWEKRREYLDSYNLGKENESVAPKDIEPIRRLRTSGRDWSTKRRVSSYQAEHGISPQGQQNASPPKPAEH